MSEKQTYQLLRNSWNRCEELIISLAEKTLVGLRNRWLASDIDHISSFLREIGFVSDDQLSKSGREYYKRKFILKDYGGAQEILTESLKQYKPVQIICQLLWGRDNLSRESVYRLLRFEGCIDENFRLQDLGSFLMSLNQCDILKYSKKLGRIKILYNPMTSEEEKPSARFLSPETPYSNIRNLWEILRSCNGFIYWIDKHFSRKGLEPLSEEADGTKIKEIKILTGLTNKINDRLRKDFIRFKAEMSNRNIDVQFRVICDKAVLQDVHDRWIISKTSCYNVPPIDSIYKGQYSEMKPTKNIPPFEQWWDNGLDLIDDWPVFSGKKPK